MAAPYDIRIRADVTDDNGNDVATLDRTYTIKDMGSVEQCFAHATKTGLLLVEGVEMKSGFEEAKSSD